MLKEFPYEDRASTTEPKIHSVAGEMMTPLAA